MSVILAFISKTVVRPMKINCRFKDAITVMGTMTVFCVSLTMTVITNGNYSHSKRYTKQNK